MSTHSGTLTTIQELVPTLGSQLLATALVLAVLALLLFLVRTVTPAFRERFNDISVETVRAATITTLTTAAALVLVVIWRATEQLLLVLGLLEFTREDVIRVVFTVVLFGTAYTLTRASKRTIQTLAAERGAISRHQQEVGHHVVQLGIYLVAVFAVFALWRINITNLLLGAGFLGLVLGLAARQTLGSVLAGFVVLFARPFELGDWVEIGDYEGVVTDISIFNTRLRTYSDEVVMVPNDTVISTEIINRSRLGRYRVEVDVGIDYDADVETAADLAEQVLEDTERVLEKPTPHVVLTEFGESSVELRLRFWIDDPTAGRMWRAKTDVIENLKLVFEREGIEIPFPQRVLAARDEDGIRLRGGSAVDAGSAPDDPDTDDRRD